MIEHDSSGEKAPANTATDGQRSPTTRAKTAADIADIYADVAERLHRWSWADRLVTGRYRRRQFGDVEGRVLDVACGTGTNFRYLPGSVDLVGVDISDAMLTQARSELDTLGRSGTLTQMDAQALTFGDDSFDTVISALSTCTFPDPVAALREMSRVCKPEGRILLLEHGRSDVEQIGRFQDWRAESHYEKRGCRWNQDPVSHVRSAGLSIRSTQSAMAGIVTRIEASPEDESTTGQDV